MEVQRSRNYGVDLLKITAMFMIVLLHTLGQGGILASVSPGTNQFRAAWFFETAAFCAVNCFGMASGYVGVSSRFRVSRLALLWLQVVFYTLLITAFFSLRQPVNIGAVAWLDALLPITRSQYWYITAYMGLLILTPLLNAGINKLSKRELTALVAALFVVFSCLPTLNQRDPYALCGGYTLLWLCLMYIVGAYIGKYDMLARVNKLVSLAVYVAAIAVAWLIRMLLTGRSVSLLGTTVSDMISLNYTSPAMFIAAAALLSLFSKLRFKASPVKKAVSLLSKTSLGVYLIHVHPLIWVNCLYGFAATYANGGTLLMLLKLFAAAAVIYLACTAADAVRLCLFRLLRIDRLCSLLDRAVSKKEPHQ